MKKAVAIVAITDHGIKVGKKILTSLGGDLYTNKPEYKKEPGFFLYSSPTRELVCEIWNKYDSIIFIMALGIVNRLIKDHIKDKHIDPAVVVVDEMGRYAISALSGHEGGANKLSEKIALICNGDFVVTTGSESTKTVIVGMGCRKGTSAYILEQTLREGLKLVSRKIEDVRLISSIEDKKNEEGLHVLSERINIPLKFISKKLIKNIEDNFSKSSVVEKNMGVGSVAEPCAILGGFRCHLILPKTIMNGTTIAIAEEKFL